MPSVDVSSLITSLNPIRQTSSYSMPVLSPRHTSSSTYTGSYRSTFSTGTTLERPYCGSTSFIAPRYPYSERYSPRSTYSTDDTKKSFTRHSSITEDSFSSRYRDDSREKSSRRDSLTRESTYRDSALRGSSLRDSSLSRSESRERSTISIPLSTIESVAEMRNKFSPANYVPPAFRRHDNITRSKSINDIGKPPLERIEPKSLTAKSKKVTDSGLFNGVLLSNQTNCVNTDNVSSDDDTNGNKKSVAEMLKKFDPIYNRKPDLCIEGNSLHKNADAKFKKPVDEDSKLKPHENDEKLGGLKFYNRPAKCFKINEIQGVESARDRPVHKYLVRPLVDVSVDKIDSASSQGLDETAEMDFATDDSRGHNHTTNFASFIPAKDYVESPKDNISTSDDSDSGSIREIDQMSTETNENHPFTNHRGLPNIGDITTSPSLNRNNLTAQNAANSQLNHTSNNLISLGSDTQRISPIVERTRDEIRSYDRNFSTNRGEGINNINREGLNGLKNIGNTCFMNSVIQCLSNTKFLLEYVRNDAYLNDINTSISPMKGALIKAFSQVINELWSQDSCDRIVNTVSLKSQIQRFAPRFMGYAQQDAQEFLRYLLEGLHEDVNRVTAKPTPILTEIDEKLSDAQKAVESWQRYLRMDNSRVVDIFVGQLKSTLRCTHCDHSSVTFDPFWDLSLPIPQRQGTLRLSQCLEHFTREETLDGDEKPTCSKCKERRKCTKSFSIQKFPKILVIHLKRFSPTERFRGKLNVIIDFPLQSLDLSPFAAAGSARSECVYNLYAVSNHSGTTYSGHYTAYCKHPYTGQWHEYNDCRVSPISPKNVVSSEAYVLFYELSGHNSHL